MQDIKLDEKFMELVRPIKVHDQCRLGKDNDGGYVLPLHALLNCENLLSLGYGNDASFEFGFLGLNSKSKVLIYDDAYSITKSSICFARELLQRVFFGRGHPRPEFTILLNLVRVKKTRRLEYRRRRVISGNDSFERGSISFSYLQERFRNTSSTIGLKIDIEGDEYPILDFDLDIQLYSFIVVEFHDVKINMNKFVKIVEKMKLKFTITNVHINNNGTILDGIPSVLEIVFVCNSLLAKDHEYVTEIPSTLDQPCDPNKPEIKYSYFRY